MENISTHKTEVCGSSPQWPTIRFLLIVKTSIICSLLTLLFNTISTTSWVLISFIVLKGVRQIINLPLTSLGDIANIGESP